MPAPTVVLFDVNETLSDLEPLRERFERVGAPGALLDTWFAGTLRDGFALTAAGAHAEFRSVALGVLRGLLGRVEGLRSEPEEAAEEIVGGFASELEVHPDVVDGMRRLAGAGVRMATLTNGSAAIAEGLLERAGLEGLVERFLSVEEVGRWKPACEPYLHAARAMGVIPERCALVAVHPWDVDGARRAGLQAGWLNRWGDPYPDVFERPTAEGATLGELAEALLAGDGAEGERRVFRPAGVSYLHIPAPDPRRTAAFYEAVFGWRIDADRTDPSFEDGSGHVIGHFIAGLPVAGEAGVLPYVFVESVDATLRKAQAGGGEVATPPYREGNLRVATFRDPAGNVVGVWQRA